MSFKYLSKEADELLSLVISKKQNIVTFEAENTHDKIREKNLYAEELDEAYCCEYIGFIGGSFALRLKPDGNNYFKNKTRYEQQMQTSSINVTASNNSPVNFNTGSGQAIQNVSIYSTEQYNAMNEFKGAVADSTELTDKQREEILELLDSLEESKAKDRKFSFNALINKVSEIIITSKTLHAIWTDIVKLF